MKKLIVILLMLSILIAFWEDAKADEIVSFQSSWLSTPLGNIKHTYIRLYGYGTDYQYLRYANPGSTGNGLYVPYTLGTTSGSRAICHSGTPYYTWYYKLIGGLRTTFLIKGSSFCVIRWLVDGTCHNGANRMLYGSGNTVSKADGYWITYQLFRNYGTSQSWNNWVMSTFLCKFF